MLSMKSNNFYRNRLPHINFDGAIQFITFCLNDGICKKLLLDPRLAAVVEEELLRFASINYKLIAYVIMPDHVHVLVALNGTISIHEFNKQLKGATSNRINKIIGRRGTLWQKDSFDHYMRNEFHLSETVEYINQNPVVAGLSKSPEEWRFSSAYWQVRKD